MPNPALGVIGTGDFASYFIAALRNGGDDSRILLSPHNPGRALALANAHGCEVATDVRSLVAESDFVLLAIRPAQLGSALAGLVFRREQIVLSAVAGVPMAALQATAAGGAGSIVRIMPSSYIEDTRDGLIPLFPDAPAVRTLLAPAGQPIAFETEEQFDLATVAACMSGWLYEFADQLAGWFVENGVPADKARLLATGNIAGAMAHAAAAPDKGLAGISAAIATEGTYTLRGLEGLRALDFAGPWKAVMEDLREKMMRKGG